MLSLKKGQLSLEMIIMLVVLLVLAGVIIMLILTFLKPETFKKGQEEIQKLEFEQKCKALCEAKDLKFCTTYWDGRDWNFNKQSNEVVRVREGPSFYSCEDRIYCFLVYDCKNWLGSGINQIKRCKELLCKSYLEMSDNDINWATEKLSKDIGENSFSTECSYETFRNTVEELNEIDWVEKSGILEGC